MLEMFPTNTKKTLTLYLLSSQHAQVFQEVHLDHHFPEKLEKYTYSKTDCYSD